MKSGDARQAGAGSPGCCPYVHVFTTPVPMSLAPPGEADVLAVTHAGHDPQIPNPSGTVSRCALARACGLGRVARGDSRDRSAGWAVLR